MFGSSSSSTSSSNLTNTITLACCFILNRTGTIHGLCIHRCTYLLHAAESFLRS
jgi:hypothetical protein